MTKHLAIGLSSFAATVVRRAAEDVPDGMNQDRTINHEDDWYGEENMIQPFEDNYIPGAPAQNRPWM